MVAGQTWAYNGLILKGKLIMAQGNRSNKRGKPATKKGIAAVTKNLKPAPLQNGIYAKVLRGGKVDGRTTLGQAMRALKQDLTRDIGGDPSTQQHILIDRVVMKTFRCQAFEAAFSEGSKEPEAHYLALCNSLRLDLQALGLQRKAKDIQSLRDYIEVKSK